MLAVSCWLWIIIKWCYICWCCWVICTNWSPFGVALLRHDAASCCHLYQKLQNFEQVWIDYDCVSVSLSIWKPGKLCWISYEHVWSWNGFSSWSTWYGPKIRWIVEVAFLDQCHWCSWRVTYSMKVLSRRNLKEKWGVKLGLSEYHSAF